MRIKNIIWTIFSNLEDILAGIFKKLISEGISEQIPERIYEKKSLDNLWQSLEKLSKQSLNEYQKESKGNFWKKKPKGNYLRI